MIIIHVKDQIFNLRLGAGEEKRERERHDMEIKFYNELPHQLQNLKNTKLFRMILKFVLSQQTYSVEKYLSYEVLT